MSAAVGSVGAMHTILIPGFWLTGDSWAPVTRALEDAGHAAHPLTLPGMAPGENAAGVGLRTHIDAVASLSDTLDGDVVLVGHSGGGAVPLPDRSVFAEPEPLLRQFMAEGHPYVAEFARARSVRIVELPTGHWPQLTKPEELATAVVDAVTG